MWMGLGLILAAVALAAVIGALHFFNLGKKDTWLDKLPAGVGALGFLLFAGLFLSGVGALAFHGAAHLG